MGFHRSIGAARASRAPFAVALALVLVLAACTTPGPTGDPQTSAAPGGQAAGAPIAKVKVSVSTRVVSLDPKVGSDAASCHAVHLTTGQLYRYDADKNPVPDLVATRTASADGLTVTFALKPNLKYSDGTALKADDVVFAYQRQKDKGTRATAISSVAAVEAPNDQTVVFKMSSLFLDLEVQLAECNVIAIHPRSKVEADAKYFEKPVSAGPYLVKEWTPGTASILLAENPNYVGGAMAVKELEQVEIADTTSRVLQVATGQVQWGYDLPLAARASLPAEVTQKVHPIGGVYHLQFNLEQAGVLSDPKVRQAISLAIDRDAVNQKAFFGAAPPVKSWIYACGPLCAAVLPKDGARDIAAAKALIAQTPYAGGGAFTIQVGATRPGWKEAALVIAESLKDIGLTVKVDPVEDAVWVANSNSGNYQSIFTGLAATPHGMLGHYFGKGGIIQGWTRYNNAEIQALVLKAGSEPDVAARTALFVQIQKLGYADMPAVPIGERAVLIGSRVPKDAVHAIPNHFLYRVKTLAEFGR